MAGSGTTGVDPIRSKSVGLIWNCEQTDKLKTLPSLTLLCVGGNCTSVCSTFIYFSPGREEKGEAFVGLSWLG